MKPHLLLAGAASVLLLATASGAQAAHRHHQRPEAPAPVVEPASAVGVTDAFASLSIGGTTISGDDLSGVGSASGLTVEGAASAAVSITPTLGAQGDVVYRTQQFGDSSDYLGGLSEHDFEAALHGFTRNDQYLAGVFGQYGEGFGGLEGGVFGLDLTHVFGGVEGQFFVNDAFTLYGQLGGKHYDFGSLASATGLFGTFEARYFLQPDFRIDAHVGYETLDFGEGSSSTPFTGGGQENTFNIGVGAEYRLTGTPFSVFGKYDYARNSFDGESGSVSDNRVLVGLKFNFDAPTLLARDRSGASLKPVESHDFDYLGSIVGSVVP